MEIVHSKIYNTGSKTSILKHPSKKQARNQHKWQYKRHGKKGREKSQKNTDEKEYDSGRYFNTSIDRRDNIYIQMSLIVVWTILTVSAGYHLTYHTNL